MTQNSQSLAYWITVDCVNMLFREDGMRPAVEIMLDVLRDEGVTHVFGNPGSTELTFMEALDGSGLRYVQGLQEAAVVSMADGYAQASGRPALVSLHAVGGLGNAMGAIAGAQLTRAPMVIIAGNQDRRHLSRDACNQMKIERELVRVRRVA